MTELQTFIQSAGLSTQPSAISGAIYLLCVVPAQIKNKDNDKCKFTLTKKVPNAFQFDSPGGRKVPS